MSIIPELRDRLGNQHVEPVQRFGLVGVDIVVCFRQDRVCHEARRGAENVRGRAFAVCFMQGREGGVNGYGAVSMGFGALRRNGLWGRRVAEDEEFYEGADEYYD